MAQSEPAAWEVPLPGEPPLRPLTLFDPPERVEVLAQVPDGPPRQFRWRGTAHRIVAQEGPERIAPEWWRRQNGYDANPGLTRDYYRVEDESGSRFWLFRHGLYERETAQPHWYVHGLFA
jgi:protein ImuB